VLEEGPAAAAAAEMGACEAGAFEADAPEEGALEAGASKAGSASFADMAEGDIGLAGAAFRGDDDGAASETRGEADVRPLGPFASIAAWMGPDGGLLGSLGTGTATSLTGGVGKTRFGPGVARWWSVDEFIPKDMAEGAKSCGTGGG
jgi:hypothetical protein